MDRSQKTIPVNPENVVALKRELLPEFVVKTFNKHIAKNWNGREARVMAEDVKEELMQAALSVGLEFDIHWLEVEEIYRAEGWRVEFDSPAYNEHYSSFFLFEKEEV